MHQLSRFLKPYKRTLCFILIALFLQTFGTLYIPTLTAEIVNTGIVSGNIQNILKTGGFMLFVAVLNGFFAITGTWFASSLASKVGRDLRNALFQKAQRLSLNDFKHFGTASMITRSTSDITQIQQMLIMTIGMMLPAPIMTVAGLILAYSKNSVMATIILLTMVIFMIAAIFIIKKTVPLFEQIQKRMDHINRTMREFISGVRVIRAFNRTPSEEKRVGKTFSDYADLAIRVNKLFAVMMPFILMLLNLCTIAIIWFGGIQVTQGLMAIGDIMAMIEYALLILYFLVMGVMVFMMLPRAQACAARVNEVLNHKPEILDDPRTVIPVEGAPRLSFKNVTFSYQNAEEPVLNDLSFTCHAGQTTAIIGGTGSGKSTIASLIPRFYDIQSGCIAIDGVDIRTLTQEALRDQIGFIPQKAFLFSGTIAENLRYGHAEASDIMLENAAKIAQAHDFISELPDGYQAPVAQGGSNFSGGQKQRLAIARALVKRAGIYVFDDSFSALDFKTDAALRKAIAENINDAAVIIVAQRITTIMDAEQIIVLDDGAIVGIGTHQELIKNCDVYRKIAESQLSKEELHEYTAGNES